MNFQFFHCKTQFLYLLSHDTRSHRQYNRLQAKLSQSLIWFFLEFVSTVCNLDALMVPLGTLQRRNLIKLALTHKISHLAPRQINFNLYTSDVAEYKGTCVLCDVSCIQAKKWFVVVCSGVFKIYFGNWIADPCYLKEQPQVILGCCDNQFSISETGPNLVNWSDPLNGGCWYNFDLHAGGCQFNLAEMPPPEIYCLNHHSTSYKHHQNTYIIP
jgi:hypothetical protein